MATLCCLLVLAAPAVAAGPVSDVEAARCVALEALFVRPEPSVALSEAWGELSMPRRVYFGYLLRGLVLTYSSAAILDPEATAVLPPFDQGALGSLQALARPRTPCGILKALEAQDLDHLLPLPPTVFRFGHEKVLAERIPDTEVVRGDVVEADRAAPGRWLEAAARAPGYASMEGPPLAELRWLGPADPVPTGLIPTPKIKRGALGTFWQAEFLTPLPRPVLANSLLLARVLNELSNAHVAPRAVTVRMGSAVAAVRSGAELLDAVARLGGYDVRLYDARMFVDVWDRCVKRGDRYFPVRMPTWLALDVSTLAPEDPVVPAQDPLLVPLIHSEHMLAFYPPGSDRPAALVKWHAGAPKPKGSQAQRFRAPLWQQPAWSGYRIVRSYAGLEPARRLVDTAYLLMRTANFLEARVRFPLFGYGMLGTCNDSVSLVEAVLEGSPERTTRLPHLRSSAVDFYWAWCPGPVGSLLRDGPDGRRVLSLASDVRPDATPWAMARARLLERLGCSIPTRDLSRLEFPELRRTLAALQAASPVFREALERAP